MSGAHERVGRVFGRVTVVRATDERTSDGRRLWLCRCICGKHFKVALKGLRSGNTRSCGCLKVEAVRRNIDLTGQRFGAIMVEEVAGTNKHGARVWRCQCDCGRQLTATTGDVRHGRVRSCGCRRHAGRSRPFPKNAFLKGLRDYGDVTRAAEHAGTSHQAAYELRRADIQFAAAWGAIVTDLGGVGRWAGKQGWQRRFLDHLAQTGRVVESSRAAGVDPTTVYRYRDGNPRFARQLVNAKCLGKPPVGKERLEVFLAALRQHGTVGACRMARIDLKRVYALRSHLPWFAERWRLVLAERAADRVPRRWSPNWRRRFLRTVEQTGRLYASAELSQTRYARVASLRRHDAGFDRAVEEALMRFNQRTQTDGWLLPSETGRTPLQRLRDVAAGTLERQPWPGHTGWFLYRSLASSPPPAENGAANGQGEAGQIGAGEGAPGRTPPADDPPAKQGRGRPAGFVDERAAEKRRKILTAYQEQRFPTVTKLAEHFHVSRSHASNIIHGRD